MAAGNVADAPKLAEPDRARYAPAMVPRLASLLVPALLSTWTVAAHAADRWAAEFHLGGAWNLPLPLVVRQDGHEDLRFRARWQTRAFELPLYYAGRLATMSGERGWMLDLTHHKLHLANPPAEVGSFAVSHGYNLLTLYRLVERDARRLGFGGGVVIAHPESEVRGARLDEGAGAWGTGYYLAGPTLGALAGWRPERRRGLYATAEARVTLSYAGVPVANGRAQVPNLALHVTVGAGWEGAR
jgi:hypothetical protein